MSYLTLHEHADGIVELRLDVPGERVNTLQAALLPEFTACLSELKQRPALQGLLISSSKADNFIVGADLQMLDGCANQRGAGLESRGAAIVHATGRTLMPYCGGHSRCLPGGRV